VRTMLRRTAVAVAAVTLSAGVAGAQHMVQFTTTGAFGGTCGGAPAACTMTSGTGTSNLTFTGRPMATYFTPVNGADLGQFTLFANRTTTGTSTFNYDGATFTLFINQINPSTGNETVVGSLDGTFQHIRTSGGAGSSGGPLYWLPEQNWFQIGYIRYEFVLTNENGLLIRLPDGTAANTTIAANITSVVPEPSTVLLLGSGIAGLGLFGLRSRRRSGSNA